MTERKARLTSRDLELLEFLWKWKGFTTGSVAVKFFGSSPVWAYNRLLFLQKNGFVNQVTLDQTGKNFVWTLGRRGFSQIQDELSQLREVGYASESPFHDLVATAAQMGGWILKTPDGVELFSEQELRRHQESLFPVWIPDIRGRRPDGFWKVPFGKGPVIFALEVELHQKSANEYGPIAQYYRDTPEIARIFWITKTRPLASKLQKVFQEVSPDKYKRHDFILLDDFSKNGWESLIYLGWDQGKSFHHALCVGQEPLIEVSLKSNRSFNAASILDARKCPFKSTLSNESTRTSFFNCMALRPYPAHSTSF